MEFTLSFKHHTKTPTTRNIMFNSTETNEVLRDRLDYCGVPSPWGWNFCRAAGCQRCRKYRAAAWIKEAQQLFGNTPKDRLRWVTTMLRPCATLNDVVAEIKGGKVAWRNIVYRRREADPRANHIRAIGVAEVDWYCRSHVSKLGTIKQKQLEGLGYDDNAPEVWFPHFHLLVDLGGSSELKLMEALERKWKGSGLRLVKMEPLRDYQTRDEAIEGCLEYATKAKHYYKINPIWSDAQTVEWDKSAVVRYYNMLNGIGGFSLQRFHLKPYKISPPINHSMTSDEPMPVSFI